jgi:hypothetical protein
MRQPEVRVIGTHSLPRGEHGHQTCDECGDSLVAQAIGYWSILAAGADRPGGRPVFHLTAHDHDEDPVVSCSCPGARWHWPGPVPETRGPGHVDFDEDNWWDERMRALELELERLRAELARAKGGK